jgi:membrane protein YdbS with pleckstrin-like domain
VNTEFDEREALEPAILVYWIGVVALISVALAAGLLSLYMIADVLPLPVVPIVPVVVLGIGALYSWLRYKSWSYQLQEDGLHLTRGVIVQVDTLVPYIRIQHIDTQRGPVDRILGLSSTVVYTAGSRGADVLIPGLKKERAIKLQDQLRRIIKEEEYRLLDAV